MRVRFSDNNTIHIVPNNQEEDRSIGQLYYRNLIQNCEHAEREIVKLINDNSQNNILLISEGYPLTVRDFSLPWYQDDTVCEIYRFLQHDKEFAYNFYKLFDEEVDKNIERFDIKNLTIFVGDVKLFFNKILRTT
jgi:hypothetical protein